LQEFLCVFRVSIPSRDYFSIVRNAGVWRVYPEITAAHPSGIPGRQPGKTGEQVSIIGIGGWDAGDVKDSKEAIGIMLEPIDQWVNFFDNSWEYHDVRSEEIMGEALSSVVGRDKVFLSTKVCARDYKGALLQLEQSLHRLKNDHIDLWQFHGIKWDDDPDLIFDPDNGALKSAFEAKKLAKSDTPDLPDTKTRSITVQC